MRRSCRVGIWSGSYQVRVTDSKGCIAGYSTSPGITAPPSPLVFSDQLFDYHGIISAVMSDQTDSKAAASGGNGSNYIITAIVDGGLINRQAY